ncbi:hypothetical protein [Azospirillum sp. TSO22-1]|uniref:hypothetical protein n=1 Tax=Azospirillum sp. TSO22-1 TaxID=716789 RepID=UPI000D6113E3|nr:hypothetical protein [Azospirillum sp. TSO22-1]PWC43506.1 hypothetical protein TSO221_19285 [Azospirillum sp. TSO22-1]
MSSRPQPKPSADDLPEDVWGEEVSEADLTPEELEDIRASEEDIAAGRTFSNEEAMAILGEVVDQIAAGTFDPANFPEFEAKLRSYRR